MNKIIFCVLFCLGLIFAQNTNEIFRTSMVISASDISNINKNYYKVFVDLEDSTLRTIESLEKTNLCEDKTFKRQMGDFNCRNGVYFRFSPLDSADLIITRTGLSNTTKSLVVCTEEYSQCDVVISKPIKLNTEQMTTKGFIIDPSLKIK